MTIENGKQTVEISTPDDLKELGGEHGVFLADLYTNNGGGLATNLRNPGHFEKIVEQAVGHTVHLAA